MEAMIQHSDNRATNYIHCIIKPNQPSSRSRRGGMHPQAALSQRFPPDPDLEHISGSGRTYHNRASTPSRPSPLPESALVRPTSLFRRTQAVDVPSKTGIGFTPAPQEWRGRHRFSTRPAYTFIGLIERPNRLRTTWPGHRRAAMLSGTYLAWCTNS